ncbi:hypothetical protein BRCON_1755 [Candidatus Sumerlaea chitinivorans]|uniref:Uncharacterized protein n=1 Tax=Sumerlaea chitinivorans TaxID=2250252 RepID=A0A2Z4Y763_SUMC1|nr:hypothetical protein BRCON_1755 [Candidatus Sumerlaea chitinivorans]
MDRLSGNRRLPIRVEHAQEISEISSMHLSRIHFPKIPLPAPAEVLSFAWD